jgi:hypothetical protein
LLIKISALLKVKITDPKPIPKLSKEWEMGKGRAQQFDDSKSLQGFMCPSEVFHISCLFFILNFNG